LDTQSGIALRSHRCICRAPSARLSRSSASWRTRTKACFSGTERKMMSEIRGASVLAFLVVWLQNTHRCSFEILIFRILIFCNSVSSVVLPSKKKHSRGWGYVFSPSRWVFQRWRVIFKQTFFHFFVISHQSYTPQQRDTISYKGSTAT
jgi:hypothetical protein